MWLMRMIVSAYVVGLLFFLASPVSAQTLLPDQWQTLPPEKIAAIVTDELRGGNSTEANQARKQAIDHLVQLAQAEPGIASHANHLPHMIRIAQDLPTDQQAWLSDTILQSLESDAVFKPDRLNKDFYYAKRLADTLKTLKADPQLVRDQNPVGQMILAQQDTLPPKFTLTDTTSGSFHGYAESYRRYHRHPAVAQCNAETIQWLRDKLAASPDVHPVAAMILSWRYRDDGQQATAEWRTFLDNQVIRTDLTGDQLAGWLLARAYLEEVDGTTILPLQGQAWIEKALVVADSQEVQLDCLRWLALGHASRDRFDEAKSVLTDHETRFAKRKAGQVFARWRQQIAAAQRGNAKIRDLAGQRAELQVVQAKLKIVQQRLDNEIKHNRDAAKIESLHTAADGLKLREQEIGDAVRGQNKPKQP